MQIKGRVHFYGSKLDKYECKSQSAIDYYFETMKKKKEESGNE